MMLLGGMKTMMWPCLLWRCHNHGRLMCWGIFTSLYLIILISFVQVCTINAYLLWSPICLRTLSNHVLVLGPRAENLSWFHWEMMVGKIGHLRHGQQLCPWAVSPYSKLQARFFAWKEVMLKQHETCWNSTQCMVLKFLSMEGWEGKKSAASLFPKRWLSSPRMM